MRVLAFESSCDDTAVAYIDVTAGSVNRLVSVVSTQVVHAAYGGVVPEVAARQHDVTLPLVLAEVARQVTGSADGRSLGKVVDAVAATAGPGLVTSLRVGLGAGRSLAAAWGKPFFGMNHIDGHVYANWLAAEGEALRLPEDASAFPALALVVSGGHTELLLMSGHGEYRLLGATRDDAAGEAFDKVAKLLGLGFPGGPKISLLAEQGNDEAFAFPRPMVGEPGDEFSFSGFKTAVRREVEQAAATNYPEFTADVAASAERAIVDTLVAKATAAAEREDVRTVLLCGGVSANKLLRRELRATLARRAPNAVFVEPQLAYCPDNAAMIAMAAYFRAKREPAGDNWAAIEAQPGWEVGR